MLMRGIGIVGAVGPGIVCANAGTSGREHDEEHRETGEEPGQPAARHDFRNRSNGRIKTRALGLERQPLGFDVRLDLIRRQLGEQRDAGGAAADEKVLIADAHDVHA